MDTYLDHNAIQTVIGTRFTIATFYRGDEKTTVRDANSFANPSRKHEAAADAMATKMNEDGLPVRITGRGFVGGGMLRAVHTIEVVVDLPRTVEFACSRCGSNQVLNDAWVAANDQDDVRVFDAAFCEQCDGPTSLKLETIESEQA